MCYRCCATWGETVIKIQCDEAKINQTKPMVRQKRPVKSDEKEPARDLGFS